MPQSELRMRWNLFVHRPFPAGIAGAEVHGVCITSVDTYAAGCIDIFVASGSLDSEREQILNHCFEKLRLVLPELEGDPYDYFSELHGLIKMCLKDSR